MQHRILRRPMAVFYSLCVALAALAAAPVSAQVVISQVYGGGGNGGATYTHDFVELFNRGNAAVDISGWTVQYASATGTSWAKSATIPTTTAIPAGGYFLIRLAPGTGNGVALPAIDFDGSSSPNLSGTTGKLALSSGSTAFPAGACPVGVSLVDFVGFGPTASCAEGSPTAILSNSTSASRAGGGCTDSASNSTDFTVGTPVARNSATAVNLCPATPTIPVVSFGSGPFSVAEGNPPTASTLNFSVSVSPVPTAGSPVTFDVAVGGPAGRFTYAGPASISVTSTTTLPIVIPVQTVPNTATDGNAAITVTLSGFTGTAASQTTPLVGNGTITDDDLASVGINAVQGTTGVSPLAGQSVTTRGVVTGIRSNAFYIQTPDAEADANALTSEGLYVFLNAAPLPAGLAIGDLVFVQGTVSEFSPPADPHQLPVTELVGSITVTPISSGNALPTPIVLASPSASGPPDQLEHLEFMRVSVPSFTVTAPTGTGVSADESFGVVTGTPRPFREPGVDILDCGANLPPEAPANVPCWDANPELLRLKTNLLVGGQVLPLRTNQQLTNVVGVLDYAFRRYSILTRAAEPLTVVPNTQITGMPASQPQATELTVSGFNVENLVGTSSATYIRKANKIVTTVVDYLHLPDIIGFIEVSDLATLNDLSARITAAVPAADNPLYVAYLIPAPVGTQNLGFLVKTKQVAPGVPRVLVPTTGPENPVALGAGLGVICPDGSDTLPGGLLNDRPPLLLNVIVNSANGAAYPATIMNNHLKSLIGSDSNEPATGAYACFNFDAQGNPIATGGEGRRNRAKRQQNAEFTAQVVQDFQTANPGRPLILVGDFNAFAFNDGYADLMNTINGTPAPDNTTVVPDDGVDLVTPDLINLTELVPAAERYSYVFEGQAQVLDHILINQAVIDTTTGEPRRESARVNGDFNDVDALNAAVPFRNSDHDPALGYFDISGFHTADLSVTGDVSPTSVNVGDQVVFSYSVSNDGPDDAINPSVSLTLPTGANFVSTGTAPTDWTCTTPVVGNPGNVACSAASLQDQTAADFTVTAQIAASAANSVVSATATVTSDSTDPTTPNTAMFNVVVELANAVPTFSAAVYNFNVPETTQSGIVIGQAPATDADGDSLTFSIDAGDPDNVFDIAADGSINVVSATQLRMQTTFTLTISVTDGTDTDTATVNITVTPVNEAPVFAPDEYAFLVDANFPNGAAVGDVIATDPDNGDTFTYSIFSGNVGTTFSIDATTGTLRVANSAGLIVGSSFNLVVRATDAGGLSDDADVSITVSSVNVAPAFSAADYSFSVSENAGAGAAVGTTPATDANAGDVITYSIQSGNTGNAFAITPSTGEITVLTPAALTGGAVFNLVVRAIDGDGASDTAAVQITVQPFQAAIFADGFED